MRQGYAVLLLLLSSLSISFAALPGISVNISSAGLDQIDKLADQLLKTEIGFLLPVHLPTQSFHKLLVFTAIIYDQKLTKASWEGFDIDIEPAQGLTLKLYGFSGELDFDLYMSLLFSGNYTGCSATFGPVDATVGISISEYGGIPQIEITEFNLAVQSATLVIPGFQTIIDILNEYNVTTELINNNLPETLLPILNSQINNFTSHLTMKKFLDPENKTEIDFSLVSAPIFTDSIEINVLGEIYDVNVGRCSYTPSVMNDIPVDVMQIYVDESVVNCGIQAFQSAGIIQQKIQQILSSGNLIDPRISLNFTVLSPTVLNITPGILQALVNWQADISRGLITPPLPVINLAGNFSVGATVGIVNSLLSWNITGNLLGIDTNLTVLWENSNLPPILYESILMTDFTSLSQRATNFINSQLGKINPILEAGYPAPEPVGYFLTNPKIELLDNYIAFATNIRQFATVA